MNTFYAQHSATARLFAVFTMFALLLSAFSAPLSAFAEEVTLEPVVVDAVTDTEEEPEENQKEDELFGFVVSTMDAGKSKPKEDKDKKVTICHATASVSNPFTKNTVDEDGLNGHGDHAGDIIPVVLPDFPNGQNLNTEYSGLTGQQILDANCVVPQQPLPVACELVIKSDAADLVVEKNAYALLLTTINPGWVQLIPASVANWIWGDDPVAAPTTADETQTFKKSFVWNGLTVDSAVLTIASDNSHAVTLGSFSGGDAGEFNYAATKDYNVASGIVNGSNLLSVEVKNFGVANTDPGSNPAGLIYELKIKGTGTTENCGQVVPLVPQEPELPKVSTVTMCKVDGNQAALSGWNLMLLGDEVDTVSVSATNGAGTDIALTAGSYVAVASGTWDNNRGPLNTVDAEYSTEDNWVTHMDGFDGYGTDILELQVGGAFGDWGAYNSLHRYARGFTQAVDGVTNFAIYDTNYGDNTGSLEVAVYEGYAGYTTDNGCVTFVDVPFGTYSVDEIMKDDWVNVSGLGTVEVDSATENFTVVNRPVTTPEDPVPVCEVDVNLLANGGFELPVVTNGAGWDIFDLTTYPVLGWAVAWMNGAGAPAEASLELHRGVNGWLPVEGQQYAELDSDWQGPAGTSGEAASVAISQTVPTTLGQNYSLSWSFSPRPGTAANQNVLEVLVDNVVVKTNTAAGAANTVWTADNHAFVGTGAPVTVTFRDAGISNSEGTFLDNVSLNCRPATNGDGDGDGNGDGDGDGNGESTTPTPDPTPTISNSSAGNGSGGRLGRSSGTPTVAGDSISTPTPEPMVLGEQVTAVPYGAPGTGHGGATSNMNVLSLFQILFTSRKTELVK